MDRRVHVDRDAIHRGVDEMRTRTEEYADWLRKDRECADWLRKAMQMPFPNYARWARMSNFQNVDHVKAHEQSIKNCLVPLSHVPLTSKLPFAPVLARS